ncbi:Uncharacterised protein [uncultured archaeon]|nr:Uncharacterised protein [uncultured archaeon]
MYVVPPQIGADVKKHFAFIAMYFGMSWWFLWTAIFFLIAGPAQMLVRKMNQIVGTDQARKDGFIVDGNQFNIN